MENESLEARALYLAQVEKLSGRQIARALGIDRKRVRRILKQDTLASAAARPAPAALEPYRNLVAGWYHQYPKLQARQIWERLKSYGSQASYPSVVRFTREYRKVKAEAYHPLSFLPGEEAQVDWFFFTHPKLGRLAGFLYVLSYSRFAWGGFYPRTSFEFFLAGHLECFEHLKGLARRHRYDNLKSVVLSREDTRIEYNPQFLDFARHFGFQIHVCNPYSGNEKGRVERLVRDARTFLYGQDFTDLKDLNQKFHGWLTERNQSIHRSTGKTPLVLLGEEKLLLLPSGTYPPTRVIPGVRVSKTALVEFETNRYSVPSTCASKPAEIIAWPERVEIWVSGNKAAVHPRCFKRSQMIQNPLHSETLLERTSHFKYQRILELIQAMSPEFRIFLEAHQDETEKIQAAYELFRLLKIYSKAILISAVRELAGMGVFKIKALQSLLSLPSPREGDLLWPRDPNLLNLSYEPRSLQDYDPAD
jgi:transposase